MDLGLDRWLNIRLLGEPMNWAIVWVIASFWLLVFHLVMTGFGAMQAGGTQASIGAGPGQIASALPGLVANFASSGAGVGGGDGFLGSAPQIWTDGYESKYAEDGWTGNA